MMNSYNLKRLKEAVYDRSLTSLESMNNTCAMYFLLYEKDACSTRCEFYNSKAAFICEKDNVYNILKGLK